MPARRVKSLMQGSKRGKDGVVWHREHRSKKGRTKFVGKTVRQERQEKKEQQKFKKDIIKIKQIYGSR